MIGLKLTEKIQEKWADQCESFIKDLAAANNLTYMSEELVDSIWIYYRLYSIKAIVAYVFYTLCIISMAAYILLSKALDMPDGLRIATDLALLWYIPILKKHISEHHLDEFTDKVCDELRNNKDQWSSKSKED